MKWYMCNVEFIISYFLQLFSLEMLKNGRTHNEVFSIVLLLFIYSFLLGNEVAERRSVIKEVILEAEAFGDIETQAEMMMQAAILDLQEKRPVADIKLLLQV